MDYKHIIHKVDELFKEINLTKFALYIYSKDFHTFKTECANRGIAVCTGASKICLLGLIKGYVIKLPFYGTYSSCCEEYNDYAYNYCDLEVEDYKNHIKDTDLENLFIETKFIGKTSLDISVYLQEEVVPFEDSDNSSIPAGMIDDAYESGSYGVCGATEETVAAFWIEFGENKGSEILDELEQLGISDLHAGNIGYRNDHLVIFDYAGFND